MMPGDDHDIVDMATFGLILRFGLHTKLSTGALLAYEYLNKARAMEMKKLLATLGADIRFYDPVVDKDICKNDRSLSLWTTEIYTFGTPSGVVRSGRRRRGGVGRSIRPWPELWPFVFGPGRSPLSTNPEDFGDMRT